MNDQYRFVKYTNEGCTHLFSVQFFGDDNQWHSLITDWQYSFVRDYCMSRFLFDEFPSKSSNYWIRKELSK